MIHLDSQTLGDDDENTNLVFQFYKTHHGRYLPITTVHISYGQLLKTEELDHFKLKTMDELMFMKISRVCQQERVTFLDYVLGGCELQVSFAVGFVKSKDEHE